MAASSNKQSRPTIFLSYSRADLAFARLLAEALACGDWCVWWDHAILPGQDFEKVIEKALHSAACVVVLWSSNFLKSDWVKNEARLGAQKQLLVPVLIEDVQPPLGLIHVQSASLVGWNGCAADTEFRKLVAAIKALASS